MECKYTHGGIESGENKGRVCMGDKMLLLL